MVCRVSCSCSFWMASSSGPGVVSSSLRGTLWFSGPCFLRPAARRAVRIAFWMHRPALPNKDPFAGTIATDGGKQADNSFLHRVIQIQPGAYPRGRVTADHRHHVGQHGGKRGFLPCLGLLKQFWSDLSHIRRPEPACLK